MNAAGRRERGGGGATKPEHAGTLRVADLMSADVVTIGPDASLEALIRSMRVHGISGMPVVAEDGTVVGTVSSTDVLWFADSVDTEAGTRGFLPPGMLRSRTVGEIMTPDVFGVGRDTDVAELRRFFARTGVHRALVLEEGRVAGIVSLSDVLATLVPEDM
jgi:CBS domain-containing membrane protein